jgi:hypothetical protein
LLLPDGRKSVEPMAARLDPAAARTKHKTLLNFVADGAWSDEAVLAAMRRQVLPAMQALGPVRFWIVDETGMPKKGEHSVGVARQYCGELGKIDNCQVLVSLSVANNAACLPIAARLYLPEAWAHDNERRATAAVPLDLAFQTKPALALEQLRAAHAAGVPPGVVLADEVYGSTATFRQGVAALDLDYAVAVRATAEVLPPLDRRRARLWRGQPALTVRALAALGLALGVVARGQRAGVDRPLRPDPGARRPRRWRGRADAVGRVAGGRARSARRLAGHPAAPDAAGHRRRHGQGPLVGRTRLPRVEAGGRPGRLRGARLARLPSPCHADLGRLWLSGAAALPAIPARRRSGRHPELSSGRRSHPSAAPTGTPRPRLHPDHAPTLERRPRPAPPALPLLPSATTAANAPGSDAHSSTPIGLMEQ